LQQRADPALGDQAVAGIFRPHQLGVRAGGNRLFDRSTGNVSRSAAPPQIGQIRNSCAEK